MDTNHTTTAALYPRDELPEFLVLFATLHESMCRDAERLVLAAPRLAPADLPTLHRWWERYEASIVHHHEREDRIVFPHLAERVATFEAEAVELHAEHLELDEAMAALADAIERSDLPALQPAAARFQDVLVRHLAREEHVVFPALAERFTAEEYAAIEKELSKGTTMRHMAFELPWILDGTGNRFDDLLADLLPAPVRLLNRTLFTPRYRRLTTPLTRAA